MEQKQDIISLDKTTPPNTPVGGGKFAGLAKLRPLLEKYKEQYGVDIQIPQTYAITTEAFDKYDIANKGVPEEIVNQAMQCLVSCGGNVAVRSSADIEDTNGQTHSGEFESVLFVQNKKQMREALETVYSSAKNVTDAKMGIIIQPMIATPKMAGVIYSQDFNGDPLIVINWTQGKPANFLLVNKEKGNLTKISKYSDTRNDYKLFEFTDINTKNKDTLLHIVCFDKLMGMINVCMLENWNIQYISQIAALANHLEKDLNYPVDIEFAISENGKISLLQQRPYVMNNNYIVKQFENGDWVGYDKEAPLIAGEIKIVDTDSYEYKKIKDSGGYANKILLSKNSKKNSSFQILAWADMKSNVLQSKLKIDACYRIHSELYGHFGNQFRESGTPFLSTNRQSDFQHLEDGDWLKIDLRTGEFKTYPKKDKTLNVANIVQFIQKSKNR